MAMIARRLLPAVGVAVFVMAFCAATAETAIAEQAPADPSGFTDRVAAVFAKSLPGASVTVAGPLFLKIATHDHGEQTAYLQNLYGQCRTTPARCEDMIAVWVDQISSTYGQKAGPLDMATLRMVVRPKGYVDQLRHSQRQEPVAAPFIADLWMICVADLPKAIEFPPAEKFEAAGLSRDAALMVCKKNTADGFSPAPKPKKRDTIAVLTGDPYASSRLLMPETWAPLLKKSHGQLLVSAPGTDMVLYTQATDNAAVDALRALTREAASHVNRVVSLAVFRWTPGGFEEVQ